MYFLTQIKFRTDGSVDKGTSSFASRDDAVMQFHVAIAAAMAKPDTKKFTAIILDEDGMVIKREVWIAPPAPEDDSDVERMIEEGTR